MPRNHGDISLNDQSDTKKATTTRKKKKKKDKDVIIGDDDDDLENTNQLLLPSISKPKKRFMDRIRKKPKSPKRCSGSHKGGCFRVMRPRRTEDDDDDDVYVSSPVSDPNDERFTHEMFRVMLETNDFCSTECNPHR